MNKKDVEKCLENLEVGLSVDGRLVAKVYDDDDNIIATQFLIDNAKETFEFIIGLYDSFMDLVKRVEKMLGDEK